MSEKKETAGDVPQDLAQFHDSYVALFGSLPALPAARFAFSADVTRRRCAASSNCARMRSIAASLRLPARRFLDTRDRPRRKGKAS